MNIINCSLQKQISQASLYEQKIDNSTNIILFNSGFAEFYFCNIDIDINNTYCTVNSGSKKLLKISLLGLIIVAFNVISSTFN